MTLAVDWLLAYFVTFARIGAMVSLVPAFGEMALPARVRLAVALAFTAIVAPTVPPLPFTIALIPIEAANGLFFGILLRLFVHALETAGTIIAQSTSLSQIFGGVSGADPQPVIGHILVWAGLTFAVINGLHIELTAYMIHSYTIVPMGEIASPQLVTEAGIAQIAHCFALAFTLSAPFVVGAFIYNVTLGVINRAMPQLMVFFVGAPAITAGGMMLLMLAAPLLLGIWWDNLSGFVMDPR